MNIKVEGDVQSDQKMDGAALVYDERQAVSLSLSIYQACNYEVCVFSSFHWTCQLNITKKGVIAIEQYRWFTVRADVPPTPVRHF